VGRVSYFIVNSMLKGKKTIVPGIGAKFLLFLMRVLPESLNILIAGRMIKKNEG
jgi:short-subunit dehydrogenase